MNMDKRAASERGIFDASWYPPMSAAGAYSRPGSKAPAAHSTAGWEVVGAVLGRGTLLVGPSPRDPLLEALVLVPPGVRVPAPEEGRADSTNLWRIAIWAADDHGNRHVDVGHPVWMSDVSLAYVLSLVELQCPEQLSWIADRIERRLLNARNAQAPDSDGVVLPHAEVWTRNAEAMLDELDIALAEERADDTQFGDAFHPWLPDLRRYRPPNPGKCDPRLAPGRMRKLYRELGRDIAVRRGND